MKKVKLVEIGEKIINGANNLHYRIDHLGQSVTVLVFSAVLMASVFGVVKGQATPYIGSAESFNENANGIISINGDQGQNTVQYKIADTQSAMEVGGYALLGTAGFGPEAVARAEEMGLSDTAKFGLLGMVDKQVMAMLSNPPGVDLDNHIANQFLPGYQSDTTVYAQGEGFEMLRSMNIEDIWEMFRNMGYALLVVIVMVAGFMIMFRFKVASGAAISLFNSLPNIILGLIFITFSFAIVGFILDLGRLLTAIIATYMTSSLSGGAPGFEVAGLGSPLEMAWNMFTSTISTVPAGLVAGGGILAGGFLALAFTPGAVIVGLLAVILVLILAAIALYAAFRVYFTLVMTWIKILIDLILGPIYIVMGSLPGKQSTITQWVKRLIAATLVFPLVFFIINFGRYVGESSLDTGFSGPINFIGGGGPSTTLIQWPVFFVIATYFFAASAPAIAQDLIGVEESKGIATAVGETKKAAGKIPLVGGLFG
ncbi:MAG: hypothetical protein PHG63_01055 [Candidatus Dojkabacteria bacterium]|nr:hypothetical protein [Candidatus Dojkabacteria bacterium]